MLGASLPRLVWDWGRCWGWDWGRGWGLPTPLWYPLPPGPIRTSNFPIRCLLSRLTAGEEEEEEEEEDGVWGWDCVWGMLLKNEEELGF